MLFHIIQALT